jgi:hypothetical protein
LPGRRIDDGESRSLALNAVCSHQRGHVAKQQCTWMRSTISSQNSASVERPPHQRGALTRFERTGLQSLSR